MGSRANLLLVNETGYELFYCHWCAQSIETGLFWGPEVAIHYITQQEPVPPDENGWLDETWSEGGVVLDLPGQVLLFYGGEDIDYQIPLRRLLLELMQYNWQDWTIRWAHDGILDMADYVQLPRNMVEIAFFRDAPDRPFPFGVFMQASEKHDFVSGMGSLKPLNGPITLFPMIDIDRDILAFGSTLVEGMISHISTGVATWEQPASSSLYGGFHVDIHEKMLSIWHSHAPGIAEHIRAHWSGWQIEWLRDNFEAHIALTENQLVLNLPPTLQLLSELETILLRDYVSPVVGVLKGIETLKNETKDFQYNPRMLIDNPPQVQAALRKRIFDACVARWKSEHENS